MPGALDEASAFGLTVGRTGEAAPPRGVSPETRSLSSDSAIVSD